jgi:hypothetical protein
MALTHAKVTINATTPTRLTPEGREGGIGLSIQVQNIGSVDVYVGSEGLTSSSYGCKVAPGAAVSLESLTTVDEVYALSSSGNTDVAVLIVGR